MTTPPLARIYDSLARVADDAGLTLAERRLVQLDVAGETREKASARLNLNPKTVESSLAAAYRKLRVRSGTELAADLSRPGRA